jgi:hypothetical protein
MRNSQRYRLNAAECLVAATSCQGDYRGLLVCIALLASWEVAEPARQTGQVLAFQPTSRTGGSMRRRDTLRASRHRRDQIDAQLVVLGERRAGHDGRP